MANDGGKKQQLIVGVDFGTTYTGLAFSYTGDSDLAVIELVQSWSGKTGGLDNKKYDKVPTEISFENNKVQWGYQLAPGTPRLGCFKLLLDSKSRATTFDDANLKLDVDPGNPNATFMLPLGMSANSVSEAYLHCLYGHVMERLSRRMLDTLDLTPITDITDIAVIDHWPAKGGTIDNRRLEKARTELSLEGRTVVLGYQLQAGESRIGCFKLLLDAKIGKTLHDDESLEVDPGNKNASYTLPPGETPLSVSKKYLKALYQHTIEHFEKGSLGSDLLALTPIKFVVTTPAVWSHEAQTATREAALGTGFASRLGDKLMIISELEAAANFILQERNQAESSDKNDIFEIGHEFIVCDAGGVTMDLVTYVIVAVSPKLVIKELVVSIGGK